MKLSTEEKEEDTMARQTQIVFTDDIDGSPASETINFSFSGTAYEVDLNEEHAAELRDTMQRIISVARRSDGTESVEVVSEVPAPAEKAAPRRARRSVGRGSTAGVVETLTAGSDAASSLAPPPRKRKSTKAPKAAKAAKSNPDVDPSAVREWANASNIPVSARGRIKQELIDQYLEAFA